VKLFDTFDDVVFAARQVDTTLPSVILSEVADEARLMLALGRTKRTRKAVDGEVRDAQVRFKDLVNKHSRETKPLTPDYVINQRAIDVLAWAVACKLNEHPKEVAA
jgi:hypothetical protein